MVLVLRLGPLKDDTGYEYADTGVGFAPDGSLVPLIKFRVHSREDWMRPDRKLGLVLGNCYVGKKPSDEPPRSRPVCQLGAIILRQLQNRVEHGTLSDDMDNRREIKVELERIATELYRLANEVEDSEE